MGFTSPQLATASLATQIGGIASSAVGSYYSAKSQASSLQFQSNMAGVNARIADTNARVAELGAQQELFRGQQQVGQLTLKAGQVKSSQRAAMAANGIDLGEGSAAEVQASTDISKEIDKNTLEANAVSSAWGYRTASMNAQIQATNMRNDALLKGAGAESISPFASAATSLLGSAGSVASNWYNYNKLGALKGTMFELKG